MTRLRSSRKSIALISSAPAALFACGAAHGRPATAVGPDVATLVDPSSGAVALERGGVAGEAAGDPRSESAAGASAATREEVVELDSEGPRAMSLSCGLANPMPGGVMAGYRADTGLDIAGSPRPVYALAAGVIEYAEAGHTLWNGAHDSPYALRIRLDAPIRFEGRQITHVWYAHLSALAREVHVGGGEIVHVAAGARVGTSGSANGCAHLHIGMLLDGEVEQRWGTFLLEDKVRAVLCGWQAATRLPAG